MKKKDWADFFTEHGEYNVGVFFYENRGSFTVEGLYQAIKARLDNEASLAGDNLT